jgi:hypothetical protein
MEFGSVTLKINNQHTAADRIKGVPKFKMPPKKLKIFIPSNLTWKRTKYETH